MSFIKQVINMEIIYCNPSPSPMKCLMVLLCLFAVGADQYRLLETAGTNNWYLEPICGHSENEDLNIDQPVMDRVCLQSSRLLSVLQYSHFLPHRTSAQLYWIISEFSSYERLISNPLILSTIRQKKQTNTDIPISGCLHETLWFGGVWRLHVCVGQVLDKSCWWYSPWAATRIRISLFHYLGCALCSKPSATVCVGG